MKCRTHTCSSEATTEVLWPGQTTHLCTLCVERARRIAEAMGFTLATGPLTIEERRELAAARAELAGLPPPPPPCKGETATGHCERPQGHKGRCSSEWIPSDWGEG